MSTNEHDLPSAPCTTRHCTCTCDVWKCVVKETDKNDKHINRCTVFFQVIHGTTATGSLKIQFQNHGLFGESDKCQRLLLISCKTISTILTQSQEKQRISEIYLSEWLIGTLWQFVTVEQSAFANMIRSAKPNVVVPLAWIISRHLSKLRKQK